MPEDQEQCRTAKELLAKVTAELAWYNSKDLPTLQKNLTDFVGAQPGWVSDYRSNFCDLRKMWCARQVDVERLCAHVRCEFPLKDETWRKVIEKCICKPKHDLCCLEHRIGRREYCCKGPHERARDEAKVALAKATDHLTWMKTLHAELKKQLDINLDLVNQINGVAPTERATVLYLFFKLHESHLRMAPFDAAPECKEVCAEFCYDKLCGEVLQKPCHEEDCGCAPKGEWPRHDCSHGEKKDGPWLMSPDSYKHALDCAYEAFHEAADALARAESDLKANPDDLATLIARRTDLLTTDPKTNLNNLENNILACLKEVKSPSDDCCREHEPKKGGC
jgi:hypothetical protein